MCPIPDDIRILLDAILANTERRITANQPNSADPVQIAANKVSAVTLYTAIQNHILDTYNL